MATYTPVWLDTADVVAWLRANAPGPTDAGEVDRVCAATEAYVERCRPEWWLGDPDIPEEVGYMPDAETYQGAVMYAARELRRRASPSGVETFGEVGVAFPTKYDTDIERALRTGGSTVPGFG